MPQLLLKTLKVIKNQGLIATHHLTLSRYADINLILKTNCNVDSICRSTQFPKIFSILMEKNFKDPHKVVFFVHTSLLAFLHIQCHLCHTVVMDIGPRIRNRFLGLENVMED